MLLQKDSFQIIPFNADHLEAAKEICDAQFGKDYLSLDNLSQYLQGSNLGLVAVNDNNVLGITLIKVGDVYSIAKELLNQQKWFIQTFYPYKKIALRKHLAVAAGQENKGIGSALVAAGMELLDKKATAIVSIVWKESAEKSLDKILSQFDSKPIKILSDYWKEDSLQKKYLCPGCKKLPCNCSAIVYARFTDKISTK